MQITSSAFNRESAQVQYLLPSGTQWQRIRSNSVQERCHARAAFGNSIFKEWKGSRYTIYIYTPCTSDRPFMARRRWERRLYKKQSYDKRYRRCKDCSRAAKTYVFFIWVKRRYRSHMCYLEPLIFTPPSLYCFVDIFRINSGLFRRKNGTPSFKCAQQQKFHRECGGR